MLAATYDKADLWKLGGIASLFVAVFAGRFSFDRFLNDASRTPWFELRVWFTLIAVLAVWATAARNESRQRRVDLSALVWLSALASLYAYLVVNSLLAGERSATLLFVYDTLIIGIQLFLVFRLVESEADLLWFARTAVLAGLALFGFCVLGFGNPDLNGHGWAPFGGPITFYRIEFFAFCCALLLYAISRWRWSWVHLVSAAVLLFSALASLSKAAFVASLAVIAGLLFWLLATSRYRWAAVLSGVAAASYIAFFVLPGTTFGASFVARVSEAGDVPTVLLDIRECPDGRADQEARSTFCVKEPKTGKILQPEELPVAMQAQLRSVVAAYGYPEQALPMGRVVELASRIVLMRDASGRLTMAARAWDMFRSNRWFGAGMGTFELGDVNQYTKEVMMYRYPHNIVLEMAATAGVVGLALFALAIFTGLLVAQRQVLKRPPLAFLMVYAPFMLIASMFGGDFFDYRVCWLALALLVASSPHMAGAETARSH